MITVKKFLEGIESIFVENPGYGLGGDGSDGTCDCIGMPRGASERAGETDIRNFRGTNQAARKTIKNLQPIKNEKQLKCGDVVLKLRDKDDPDMKLPDKYRKGGSEYDPVIGEKNYTHIGTVTKEYPDLEITHMTSPHAQKDHSLGKWKETGQLPWISYDEAEADPDIEKAVVIADSGKTVKMRAKPSTLCRLYWDVPIGSEVIVMNRSDKWSEIIWNGRTGYMKNEFLTAGLTYAVIIPGLPEDIADEIVSMYVGAYKEIERG